LFSAEGVTWKTCTSDKIPKLEAPANAAPTTNLTGMKSSSGGAIHGVLLEGVDIPKDQVGVCDVHVKHAGTPPFESIGRVIAYPPSTGLKSEWKVEIDTFPKQILPKPPAPADQKLFIAKMEFAFKAARIALGRLDGPPTSSNPLILYGEKAEEMKFLWTALVILGENNPKMSFKPNAIKVEATNNVFNPASEQGLFFGFKSDSLYNSFKELGNVHSAQKEIDVSKAIIEKRVEVTEQVKKVESQVIQATLALKENFKEGRKKAEDEIKEHGLVDSNDPGYFTSPKTK
jgi:hypothetical protein